MSNEQSVKTKFDRGYCKLYMIKIPAEKNYDVLTVAAASGSKHCFLTQEEVDKTVKESRSKGKEDKLINAMLSAISPFILLDNNAMRSLVRMAKRTVTLDSDKSCVLYAIAVHETQDPKKCSSWIRLFATGDEIEELKIVVVATKKSSGIDSCALFPCGKKVIKDKVDYEQELGLNSCGPKSLG